MGERSFTIVDSLSGETNMTRHQRWILAAALLLTPSITFAQGTEAKKAPPAKVDLKKAIADALEIKPKLSMVPMRDGTPLATDVYVPSGKGPWPTIYLMTPYGRGGARSFAKQALNHGYAVVSQDIRGRGDSHGHHAIVFSHNGWTNNRDGHQSIEWIAKQPWSDGKVATWGGSALGITQNLNAVDAPSNLVAQHVLVACSNVYQQCIYQGGVFRHELIEGWLKATRMVDVNLATYVAHPNEDSFWAMLDPASVAERVNAPAVYVGGWYDIFAQGTIDSFVAVQTRGGPRARGKCRLVMGPMGHGVFKDLDYPDAHFPAAADPIRFYDHHLKGRANGVEREKAVHYYVMGDPTDKSAPGNRWRHVDDWPPPADVTPYYFTNKDQLRLTAPDSTGSRAYAFDPEHPVPTIGGQNLLLPLGPKDQRSLESRPDVLVYSTEALAEPIEVTGRIIAKLFVSSDCPDTDFTVKLCDVYPDGRSMLVTDGILRARHRLSMAREDFLEPGKVYPISVDLWSTSLVFNKGHRIRVALSSSNAPRFEPNPNTGKPFRADNEKRVAHNTVHLSKEHPSHILLPIHRAPTTDRAAR